MPALRSPAATCTIACRCARSASRSRSRSRTASRRSSTQVCTPRYPSRRQCSTTPTLSDSPRGTEGMTRSRAHWNTSAVPVGVSGAAGTLGLADEGPGRPRALEHVRCVDLGCGPANHATGAWGVESSSARASSPTTTSDTNARDPCPAPRSLTTEPLVIGLHETRQGAALAQRRHVAEGLNRAQAGWRVHPPTAYGPAAEPSAVTPASAPRRGSPGPAVSMITRQGRLLSR